MRRDMGTIGTNAGRVWRLVAALVWLALGWFLVVDPASVGWQREPFFVVVWIVGGTTSLYWITQALSRGTNKVLPESTHVAY